MRPGPRHALPSILSFALLSLNICVTAHNTTSHWWCVCEGVRVFCVCVCVWGGGCSVCVCGGGGGCTPCSYSNAAKCRRCGPAAP